MVSHLSVYKVFVTHLLLESNFLNNSKDKILNRKELSKWGKFVFLWRFEICLDHPKLTKSVKDLPKQNKNLVQWPINTTGKTVSFSYTSLNREASVIQPTYIHTILCHSVVQLY